MSNTGAATAPTSSAKESVTGQVGLIVAYICENCARGPVLPSSGLRRRPTLPRFDWSFAVHEISVPCAGRLQPEHFLKALEDGADAVGVICCEDGNCHHLEGNRRCRRRLDYVAGVVEQVGLGPARLVMFQLPGSAAEDMAMGVGMAPAADPNLPQKIAAVRDAFAAHVAKLSPNPLRRGDLPDGSPYEVDSEDESDE
jgi:F420-non-reducing hydrogenase iron-sulfur subunit